jgi:hypothetical protein
LSRFYIMVSKTDVAVSTVVHISWWPDHGHIVYYGLQNYAKVAIYIYHSC